MIVYAITLRDKSLEFNASICLILMIKLTSLSIRIKAEFGPMLIIYLFRLDSLVAP